MLVFKTGGWGVLSGGGGGGGGIPEAPLDGQTYGRNDATWIPVSGGTGFAPYRGARIRPTAEQSYTVTGAWTNVRFASADRNTANAFWAISAPNRLVVPTGVSKVRLSAAVQASGTDILENNQFSFYKNGVSISAGGGGGNINQMPPGSPATNGYNNPGLVMVSDTLDVSPGDYFELMYFAAGSFTLGSANTWFAMEVIERTTNNANLQELLDVLTTTPTDGQSLVYDATAGKWKPGSPSVVYPGELGMYRPFRGAMAKQNADRALSATLPIAPVPWDGVDYDTNTFWSAGSPGRFTIPAGVKKIRLQAMLQFLTGTFATTTITTSLGFMKNGSSTFRGNAYGANTPGYTDASFTAVSGIIPVVEGDYFEVRWNTSRTGAATIEAARSFFQIEVIEAEETLP